MSAPGRSHSLPTAESSQGPSFGRRTQSDTPLTVPAPIIYTPPIATDSTVSHSPFLDDATPTQVAQTQTQCASAPSPAPTEIIPPDLTPDEIVDDIQRMGIKVRDFAYENVPQAQRAPELFDPVMTWNHYEDALANTDPRRNAFSGRSMRRLLDLGWISEALDGPRWQPKDRDALEEFDSRPQYPWKAFNLSQPRREKLKEAARARLQFVHVGQWPPEVLARGIARIGGFFRQGPAEKRPAEEEEEEETDQKPEGSPRSKKLRLSNGTPGVSVVVHPPSMQHSPRTLVNGKPLQQFPAGRRPESPPSTSRLAGSPSPDGSRVPRPSTTLIPKQYPAGYPSDVPPRSSLTGSPLGRPLQRQQTLSAVYPSDRLARSDSRTSLTERARS